MKYTEVANKAIEFRIFFDTLSRDNQRVVEQELEDLFNTEELVKITEEYDYLRGKIDAIQNAIDGY